MEMYSYAKNKYRSVFLLIFILCGCSTAVSKRLSAGETVQYYFEQFNQKNQKQMELVVNEEQRGVGYDLDNLIAVKLISMEEEKDAVDFNSAWYDGQPEEIAMVRVTFDIEYKNGGGAGFDNGSYQWNYYLVKENEDSDWVIVMWGC